MIRTIKKPDLRIGNALIIFSLVIVFISFFLMISSGGITGAGMSVMPVEEAVNETVSEDNITEPELAIPEPVNETIENITEPELNIPEPVDTSEPEIPRAFPLPEKGEPELSIPENTNETTEIPENETFPSTNETEELAVSESSEQLFQGPAEIGKPVKWIKKIKLARPTSNLTVTLPKQASNISVKSQDVQVQNIKIEGQSLQSTNAITGGAAAVNPVNWLKKFWHWLTHISITGAAVLDTSDTSERVPRTLLLTEQGSQDLDSFPRASGKDSGETIDLVIGGEVQEVEIEYETPAPQIKEERLTPNSKRLTIYSDVHYENILTYTDISESPFGAVKLYHIANGNREIVNDAQYLDTNSDGKIDKVTWVTPSLSEEIYEIDITILNVQSYPTVGGNWEVRFTTIGTADLTIKAVNGTTWSNENENNDLKFLEVRCGSEILNYEWKDGGVFIPDYNCDETGSEISKVLTSGKHDLEFCFGGDCELAHNLAVGANWWDTTFNYRMNISVAENSGSALTDYQVNVILNPETFDYNKALSDGADIRFTNASGTELDYWIEEWMPGGSSSVWVEVPTIASSATETIYMYFGNSSAVNAASNGTNTFRFFDDAEMGDPTDRWTTSGTGTLSYSNTVQYGGANSIYMYDSGAADVYQIWFDFDSDFLTSSVLDFYARFPDIIKYRQIQVQNSTPTMIFLNWWQGDYATGEDLLYYNGVTYVDTNYNYAANNWYHHQIIFDNDANTIEWIRDGTTIAANARCAASIGDIDKTIFAPGGYQHNVDTGVMYVDNIFLRKYITNEPTATLNYEEASTSWADYFEGTGGMSDNYNISVSMGYVSLTSGSSWGNFTSLNLVPSNLGMWDKFYADDAPTYSGELPDNAGVETGGADMSNNVLLQHMDEGTDNTCGDGKDTCDTSGTGNNGTFKGAGEPAWTATSKFGSYAIDFAGDNDYATIADHNSLDLTGDMTIEMWIMMDSNLNNDADLILSKRYNSDNTVPYQLIIDNRTSQGYTAPVLKCWLGTGSAGVQAVTSTTLTVGQWNHIACVVDGTNIKTYIDGEQSGSAVFSGTRQQNNYPIWLGTYPDSGSPWGFYFNGKMDELAIYSRALTDAEINEHYLRGTNARLNYSVLDASDDSVKCTITSPQAAASQDISGCAGTTSSIKLFANLTAGSSPEVYAWNVSWNLLMVDRDQDGTFESEGCQNPADNGDQCDMDGDSSANGFCVNGVCDTDTMGISCGTDGCAAADEGNTAYATCSDGIGAGGKSCVDDTLPAIANNFFTQEGVCEIIGSTCDTSGHACGGVFGDVYSDCSVATCNSAQGVAVGCDPDATSGGDYLIGGICGEADQDNNDDDCLTGAACKNSEDNYAVMEGCECASAITDWDQYDSDVSNGAFSGDGICIGATPDTTTHACRDGATSNMYSDCSNANCGKTAVNNDECDSDITDGAYQGDGMCVSGNTCDINEVCADTTDNTIYNDCTSCSKVASDYDKCSSGGGTSFSANGVCVETGADDDCRVNGNVIYDDEDVIKGSCSTGTTTNVDPCDASLASATYTPDGMCTSAGGGCATADVYADGSNNLQSGCTNGGGEACTTDAVNDGSLLAWSANGICVSGSTCDGTTEAACDTSYNDPCTTYFSSCSGIPDNQRCDTDISDANFGDDQGICSSDSCISCTADEVGNCADNLDNDCDGGYDWGGDPDCPKAISLGLSNNLSVGAIWSIASLPATNANSTGNNDSGNTLHTIAVSANGTTVDIYILANANLTDSASSAYIGLGNESFTNSTTDQTIAGIANTALTAAFQIFANNLADGTNAFLKFFLSAPASQAPGDYNNTLTIKAVEAGDSP